MEFRSYDYTPIVEFYAYNYLYALSGDPYHNEMMLESAEAALVLFKLALEWELNKASIGHKQKQPLVTGELILSYIRSYPLHLHQSFNLLGEKWEKIAELIYGNYPIDLKVDALVDMDHNFGNVLTRIIRRQNKYFEFLTTKAYAKKIIEFIFFIDDYSLKRTILRASKEYEKYTLEDYKRDFMKLNEELFAKAKMSDTIKDIDLENIARRLEQCQAIDADSVFERLKNDEYAWCGLFRDISVSDIAIYGSTIKSGQFTDCVLTNVSIEGGFFERCVMFGCNFRGSATVKDSSLDDFYIYTNASPTFINVETSNAKNASLDTASIDMKKMDTTIVK